MPDKIGKYVIINEVGQGSTGRVFLSHDAYYGRDVAIKLYNIESEEDDQKARVTRKMFFNEAQMMGRLQHPNILPIYDAGEEDGGRGGLGGGLVLTLALLDLRALVAVGIRRID